MIESRSVHFFNLMSAEKLSIKSSPRIFSLNERAKQKDSENQFKRTLEEK
jgi:hypothetical protein